MNPRPLVLALAATLSSLAQAAVPPPAGGVTDLLGPRALALGGAVGVVAGNEGLLVNPAAVAVSRRYSVETLFALDRRGATSDGKWLGGSVVDNLSSPVAASFGYVRSLDGGRPGNLLLGGLAAPLADKLWMGVLVRYLDLSGGERVKAASADLGLLFAASDLITVGAAGYNLIPTHHEQILPRGAGAGLSIGSDTGLKLTADWHGDFDRARKTTNRFGVGLEALLGNMLPLRAGWQKDETLSTSWWSVGAGLVTQGGVSLDLGYRQSLTWPDARVMAATLRVHFLEM